MHFGRSWLLFCFWLCFGAALGAAEAGVSVLRVEPVAETGGIELTLTMATADVERLVSLDGNRDGRIDDTEWVGAEAELRALGRSWVAVLVDGAEVGLRPVGAPHARANHVCAWTYAVGRAPEKTLTLIFRRLGDLPAGHVQVVEARSDGGRPLSEQRVSGTDATVRLDWSGTDAQPARSAEASGAAPGFWAFLKLGVEHIWTGYDHLLFLAGLLLVCQKRRAVLVVITSFTVAHSLTLGAAALGVVNLSPRVVEPMIAASIVFVGVENILRRGEPKARWAVTFLFGLIHGFGFASVLRDLGLGQGGLGLAGPLAGFNLGVEAGQLAVAAVILPVFGVLRKRPAFEKRWMPALSAVVVLVGLFWLIERLVG